MLTAMAQDDPAALAGIEAQAAAVPNGEGRFWRVERPGTAPSHLFGTFHASAAAATVPDAAWAALDDARLVVLEIDLDEQTAIKERLARNPQLAYDRSAPPLSSRLDDESIATIRTALTLRGVPGALGEQMRPWMLFSLLSLPVCEMQAQVMGAQALDAAIARRASEAGVPQQGLETFDDVIAAFDRIGPEALLAMLAGDRAMLDIEEDAFRTTLDLYADGRIAAIASFTTWLTERYAGPGTASAGDAALAVLVDGRNAAWLPALEDALGGGNAFVAVGALHLPGEHGLIEMLRDHGWTVARLD
jgi:uncharacterized protein YbaP (TraB family)